MSLRNLWQKCLSHLPNVIQGTNGPDTLVGTDGNDTIYGGDGQDVIYGGMGRDELHGGNNGDAIQVGPGDEASGDGGIDTYFLVTDETHGTVKIHLDEGELVEASLLSLPTYGGFKASDFHYYQMGAHHAVVDAHHGNIHFLVELDNPVGVVAQSQWHFESLV